MNFAGSFLTVINMLNIRKILGIISHYRTYEVRAYNISYLNNEKKLLVAIKKLNEK